MRLVAGCCDQQVLTTEVVIVRLLKNDPRQDGSEFVATLQIFEGRTADESGDVLL